MTTRPSQRPSFLSRTVPSPFFRFFATPSPPHHDVVQEPAYDLSRPAVHVSGDMGVGVQGEGRLGVTQDTGERFGVHPAGQSVGSEGVPEVSRCQVRGKKICGYRNKSTSPKLLGLATAVT